MLLYSCGSDYNIQAVAEGAAAHGILQSERALGTDICVYLRRAMLSYWQDEWTATRNKKLRALKPRIEVWQFSFSSIRKEEVLLARLRIGHTRLTHGHLLGGDAAPLCVLCGLPPRISHTLSECPHCVEGRRTFRLQSTLRDILRDGSAKVTNVEAFLRCTGVDKFI
jgi:hypothetical protein